ncbi:MAG: SRPBCC family protein [Hyphomicrobiaceae bacterium]
MPSLTEKITIASPLETVWPLLSDPETVASCIPGATLSEDREDDLWKGSISVKFGPTVAVFRGEAELTYDDDAHTCKIEGRGIDQRGASRALANGLMTAAAAGETTELTVDGDYSVSGPLETFANAGGVHVARALLAEFATNMAKLTGEGLAANTPQAEPSTTATPDRPYEPIGEPASALGSASGSPHAQKPAAKELNAFALLWAALKSWIGSLFGKGK